MMACGTPSTPRPPANHVATTKHKEVYCPEGERKPSSLSSKDPAQGGYRRLPDEIARQTVVGAIATSPMPSVDTGLQASSTLGAAIYDLQDEIRTCMKNADTVGPNLQYGLNVSLRGSSAATIVDSDSLKRIEGANPDGTARAVTTTAESCVGTLLQLLELPPSSGRSGMAIVMRYDFCTSAYDVGRTIAQEYSRAFPKWLAAHPNTACPSRVEDLHPYMQGAKETIDPWGQPFRLRCNSGTLEVWSAGRDGKPDTKDDVTSWR